MKKNLSAALLFVICVLCACKSDPDWAAGTLNPTVAINDIRSLYKDGNLRLTAELLAGAVQTCGIVSSDYTEGNIPEGVVVVQNTRRSKTSGIAVYVGELASTFQQGDSLLLRIEDKILTRENGVLTIRALDEEDITVLSRGHRLNPIPVKVSALLSDPGQYESVLIKITNCVPVETPGGGATYEGGLAVDDGTGMVTIGVREGTALASKTVPADPVTYIGLLSSEVDDAGVIQLSVWPRSVRDIIEKYVILAWDLRGYNITQGPTRDATKVDDNLEMSALSRGPGLTAAQAGDAFSATWPVDVDKDAAVLHGSYYQFSLTPKDNVRISLLSIDIALRVQANGPRNYCWMYSLDGGNSFAEMSDNLVFKGSTSDNNGIMQPTLNIEEVAGVQEFSGPMIIRLYAWGAIDNKSTFRIGKSLTDRPYALSVEGMVQTEKRIVCRNFILVCLRDGICPTGGVEFRSRGQGERENEFFDADGRLPGSFRTLPGTGTRSAEGDLFVCQYLACLQLHAGGRTSGGLLSVFAERQARVCRIVRSSFGGLARPARCPRYLYPYLQYGRGAFYGHRQAGAHNGHRERREVAGAD